MNPLFQNKFLCLILLACMSFTASALEIWVSPSGNDFNNGTQTEPLQSIAMAQRKVRELRRTNDPSVQNGVQIILADGTHTLGEPLLFRPEDSGREGNITTVKAAEGASPVISSGVAVTNWSKATRANGLPREAAGKVRDADMPRMGGHRVPFRQMWVNGEKAIRASNLNDGPLDRILSADHKNESFWIPKPKYNLNDIAQLEFVIHQWWAIAILRVKEMKTLGDSVLITFHQPDSRIEFEHPWPAPFIDKDKNLNGNSAFYFVNHLGLLNSPGEWYADFDNGKVYYWPREGENMATANVVVPYLETLVQVEGTLDLPVQHITFENVSFEHTTWMRPSQAGHVPLQAGFFLLDAYKLLIPGTADKAGLENQAWLGRQPGGVTVSNANHIVFDGCQFKHMAATGLDFITGTAHSRVSNNTISDVGGTGLQIGFFGDEAFEAHLPYDPADEREVCRFITVDNNLITDCTNEDWGCVGISVGFARDINIEHNEVSHLNYSGICIGWGWTRTITCMRNNRVHANYIHNFARQMYDVGGIYTLSAQPNTEISENRIEKLLKAPYAHIPDHYQYIYFDEGSSYIRAINNWTEADKFFSNTPGPGNEWNNNGPQVSDEIKNKAGRRK